MMKLWTVEQAAEYWGVSLSRARAILADRGIRRVSGYDADEIRAVVLRQGARTDLIEGTTEMKTFDATDLTTRETYRFRSLDALARRLGGDGYQVEHDTAFAPPMRRVMITKRVKRGDSARNVITTVVIPSEAL